MDDGVPMDLKLVAVDGFGEVTLDAASPLLDPDLHPGGAVRVLATDVRHDADDKHLGLGAFQLASIRQYVSSQAKLKELFERGLRALEPDEPALAADPWTGVRVARVVVGPLRVPTAQGLATMREQFYPTETLEQVAARYATPGTETEFEVVLEPDWDDEHQRLAHFRDGHLLSFTLY